MKRIILFIGALLISFGISSQEHFPKKKSVALFISEGDALDVRGNSMIHASIDGRENSLEIHQTEFWKRYSNKYDSEK